MDSQKQPDEQFYKDGVAKMINEGLEVVSKMMAFLKSNDLQNVKPEDRKKLMINQSEEFKTFNQVHPIVFQYLVAEGVFNQHAFKRYIKSVFGKPKSKEDQEKMVQDKKYVYYFKNAQHALYYKYLMIEANPRADKKIIDNMYNEMVTILNEDSKKMLEAYEKAQADAKITEENLTKEKRQDLVNLLKTKFSNC
jgi:hypothetical protein